MPDQAAAADSRAAGQSLILVKASPTESFLWDGQDLKKRIDFAMLGLDLCLPRNEIELELRRSIFTEITAEDLKRTIILNSKTLIEKDADFAKFAARILLSYIYEEVLGWDIVRDGIEQLPAFHRRAFKKNISSTASRSSASTRASSTTTSTSSPPRSTPPPTSTSTSSASRRSTTATSSWTRRPSPHAASKRPSSSGCASPWA